MSGQTLTNRDLETFATNPFPTYRNWSKTDRMTGVIVETHKKRVFINSNNQCELLSKEEACCDQATD